MNDGAARKRLQPPGVPAHPSCTMGRSLLIAALVAFARPTSGQSALRVDDLQLRVALDYQAGRLDASATVTFQHAGPPMDSIPLQVNRGLRITSITDGAGHPLRFTQGPAGYQEVPALVVTQAWIRLPAPLPAGRPSRLRVDYAGTLEPYADAGLGYVRDRVDSAFTILRADGWAFPVLAPPSLAVLTGGPRPHFTYRAVIEVPRGQVVATGTPPWRTRSAGSRRVWEFRSSAPVPFLNIAIAPFGVVERGGIRVFHLPGDADGAHAVLDAAHRALDAYTDWFGGLGEPPRLHVIEIPEGWGSQASLTGGIIQTADAFRSSAAHPELYHELAHLWHPAELDEPPSRWTEGLATFLQWRVSAEVDGVLDLDSAAEATLAGVRRRVAAAGHDSVAMRDYGRLGLTDYAYRVGGVMCWALYQTLGGEAFDRIIGAWMRRYRHAGSTASDFAALVTNQDPRARAILEEWLWSAAWADSRH